MFKRLKTSIQRLLSNENLIKYTRIRSSIYGRVVFIVTSALIILFIIFNIVFRSVYTQFFNTTVRQNGNNISSIVEGALYYSMLENDKAMLQQTLDVISTMSGIDEVNMYDHNDSLAFTSVSNEKQAFGNPNCKECHNELASMFHEKKKSYRIVGETPECQYFHNGDNDRHLVIRKPIINQPSCYTSACHAHSKNDEILGALIIKLPLKDLDSFVDRSSTNFLILAGIITALLVSFLMVFTRKKIKDPLNSIIIVSESVSKGDNSKRISIKPNLLEDLKKVSSAFNNMLDNIERSSKELQNWSQQLEYKVQKKTEELLDAQNELIHIERIASLGKLSSSVAHEINNPLSGILIYTKLIYKQLSNDQAHYEKKEAILKHLKFIETETKRCGEIVKGLLDFSRKDQDDFVVTPLHPVIKATCDLMSHSIKIADIEFIAHLNSDKDDIYCNPNQIKQACVALLVNALEAIQDNGKITVKTWNPDQESIMVEITDNGKGIAAHDLPHIFEPFFSTKKSVNGTGLGLSIVHGIIENHKGNISVDSEPGKGTTMALLFPLTKN